MLILPFLIVLNIAFSLACELTFLGQKINGPSERLLVLKTLDNYVREKRAFPKEGDNDIVILSSSLGITSAALTDSKVYGYPPLNSIYYMRYSRFRYLDEQIKNRTGVTVHTLNLSNAAIMISEQLLMLKELIRVGAKPKLVILEIAPRDFLDHWTAAYNRSRLAQILIMRQTPLTWQGSKSIAANVDVFSSKLWPFYSQRVEMKDYLVRTTCETFGRPATLFQAQVMQRTGIKPAALTMAKKAEDDVTQETPTAKELETAKEEAEGQNTNVSKIVDAPPSPKTLEFSISDYKGRYLPPDRERWDQEFKSFEQLLVCAEKNKVPLLIVAMPLTKCNRDLLPPLFLTNHRERLRKLIALYPQSNYCDLLDSEHFLAEDFIDTVHLGSTGGAKLAESFASKVFHQ